MRSLCTRATRTLKARYVAVAVHLLITTACFAAKVPLSRYGLDISPASPEKDEASVSSAGLLPSFLHGEPEHQEVRLYSRNARAAAHTASGEGLHTATTGVPASFTIQLVGDTTLGTQANTTSSGVPADEGGGYAPADWTPANGRRFIYVWIASKDQIMIAEVTQHDSDGSDRGTSLTASYTSHFPGEYLVYIEEVDLSERHEGRPIVGSPYSLTITSASSNNGTSTAATLDIESLPVCDSEEDTRSNIAETFWRPGTWLSSNVASPTHGVTRNGWVFQPKTCVLDAFSYDDLMLMASLQQEPTWLLVLGGSVQRGMFLTLVDMALKQGQKDNMNKSAVQKCWGYADVRIGSFRITYQDMRLYRLGAKADSVVCNNEKLISGSTGAMVHSCEQFLSSNVFQGASDTWPSVIMAPSNLVETKDDPNLAIEVLMEALPPTWTGKLMFVDHMAGFGFHWGQQNPTRTALKDVGITYHKVHSTDQGLEKMGRYRTLDPRVTFMSAFPMYQAKLFENQASRDGIRIYGRSQHYHVVSQDPSSPEAYNGARMVQSTMTDMLANIMLGKAVGTKAALYDKAAAAVREGAQVIGVGKTFQLCWDCPDGLLPFHVKPIPEPACEVVEFLPDDVKSGEVWDGEICPRWCMEEVPVSQTETESGPVDVRECVLDKNL